MKLIDLHKEWCEKCGINDRLDTVGNGGLCNAIPTQYLSKLELFEPDGDFVFWASGHSEDLSTESVMYNYGRLRQTIVLLICAMNNEL